MQWNPVELFITLRDDALKCCTQHVSKSARPSRGHRTGKGQFSSQFPRRAVLKNVQTVGQLHSSPMQMLKIEENNRRGKTRDLFRKIGNIKGTFFPKMGTIKERNG